MDIKTKLYIAKIFDNDLVAIHESKVIVNLKKPAYIGMYILSFIKVLMNELQYHYINNKYSNKSKLLLTDTDSSIYKRRTEECLILIKTP